MRRVPGAWRKVALRATALRARRARRRPRGRRKTAGGVNRRQDAENDRELAAALAGADAHVRCSCSLMAARARQCGAARRAAAPVGPRTRLTRPRQIVPQPARRGAPRPFARPARGARHGRREAPPLRLAQETLVVKVVPGQRPSAAPASTARPADGRARLDADLPRRVGTARRSAGAAGGRAQPERDAQVPSKLAHRGSLGAASDLEPGRRRRRRRGGLARSARGRARVSSLCSTAVLDGGPARRATRWRRARPTPAPVRRDGVSGHRARVDGPWRIQAAASPSSASFSRRHVPWRTPVATPPPSRTRSPRGPKGPCWAR